MGLIGTGYLIIVIRRMRNIDNYQTPLRDWLWYVTFPLVAYAVLIIAAIALPANPALMLFIIHL